MVVAKAPFSQAFSLCVAPFILLDILKIIIASAFSMALKKAIPKLVLQN